MIFRLVQLLLLTLDGLRKLFWAVSIPNKSDGYPNAFLYVEFLACLIICTNTTFPKLNSLHSHLEEQGGEALQYSCAVGSR